MRAGLLTAVLTVALVSAACGGDDDGRDRAADVAATASSVDNGSAPPPEDPAAGILAFEASAVDGATIDVSALAGTDLAIWFWAPW